MERTDAGLTMKLKFNKMMYMILAFILMGGIIVAAAKSIAAHLHTG